MPSAKALAHYLEYTCNKNDQVPTFYPPPLPEFRALIKPSFSMEDWMKRLYRYIDCSDSCYIVALIYLQRLSQRVNHFVIQSFNIHRSLLVSLVIANKFLEDNCWTEKYMAEIGGISIEELKHLELRFVSLMQFDFFVSPQEFDVFNDAMNAWDMSIQYFSQAPIPYQIPYRDVVITSQCLKEIGTTFSFVVCDK